MALRNGIVREYKITITEVETETEIVLYSTDSPLILSTLHPFYTYVCRVSAFTVEYGPYSEESLIVTPQDGE